MNFSTLFFVFVFLPVSLILYLICPRVCKNALLVLVSFCFYAWGQPLHLLLLLLVTVFNYCVARDIGARVESDSSGSKSVLAIGVLFNLLLLVFYKYTGFFAELLSLALPFELTVPTPALPLGISFFTFQNISCLSDVYHKRAPALKNPLDFCLYVSFFPKMVSGPIVPYAKMQPQLRSHPVTLDKVADGVPMLVVGLAKKVLLADGLAVTFQAISGLGRGALSGGSAWLGALCYTLQLYFDFSGYSDMAIGMGWMLGFHFDENFNYPYVTRTITEFWRRWHMTLGRWFKKYLYFPLGGSRCSFAKTIRNTFVVWAFTGLWHGASWNFVLWGVYFGIIIIIEKLFLGKYLEKAPAFLSHLYAIFLFTFGWVLFDFTDMGQMRDFIVSLFNGGSVGLISHDALVYVLAYLPVLII